VVSLDDKFDIDGLVDDDGVVVVVVAYDDDGNGDCDNYWVTLMAVDVL
jgi:hypothetical protein